MENEKINRIKKASHIILEKIKISGILVTVIVLTSSIGTAVIVGLTFWCIYCIFDYGMELQKSADETL